jgi:TolB protein
MKRLLLLLPLIAASALAQTQITTSIGPNQAAKSIAIVVPRPDTALPLAAYNSTFWAPFTRDITYSGVFAITPYPPNVPVDNVLTKSLNAQFFLLTSIRTEDQGYAIEARLIDTTGKQQFGKVYHGTHDALTRIAHTIANELVRMANGKPSVFLSQIAFASNRDGNFEIYLMDWDGGAQRRITRHNALSILPSWAPDNERIVYTSFFAGTSDMYIISRRGGGRIKLKTGLNLNTSATFSPVGNDIAFVGSINGNPDIYLIKDDGTNIRRLTTDSSIESTPEWSPNGRQISFTSGRGGTPQIYIMDAEGSNVRRMSFEGDWNDDATWSPNGDEIAYTSRVNGRFQIRIQNSVTGQSRIVAGEGSNEQPTWSPDGQWLAFQSNRSGTWQIYRMRVDGTDIQQLTFDGENKDPDWSKKAE